MVRSHIGSTTRDYGVVLKLERLSHQLDQSFGLDSPIEVEYLSRYFCNFVILRVIINTLLIRRHILVLLNHVNPYHSSYC